MICSISDAFTLLADLYTEYVNLYTMLESNGHIRLTIETSKPNVEHSQSICLVLSNRQAETISKLITASLEGEIRVVQNINEVE